MNPPFRADHVGSLLRPQRLKDARTRFEKNELTKDELRTAEDDAIREVVGKQEAIGLQSITDGEYRRTFFHIDFLQRLQGVAISGGIATRFHTREGEIDFAPPRVTVTGKLRHVQDIQTADFQFLQSVTTRTPKVTIPSPTMVHFRGGRKGIDITAYPGLDEFFEDLAQRPTVTRWGRCTRPGADTSSSTTPTSPTCATRRSGRRRPRAATIPTSCRTPMRR